MGRKLHKWTHPNFQSYQSTLLRSWACEEEDNMITAWMAAVNLPGELSREEPLVTTLMVAVNLPKNL